LIAFVNNCGSENRELLQSKEDKWIQGRMFPYVEV